MSGPPIRVLCVDDHAFLAEGLRSRFALEDDLVFAGWLESADNLVSSAQEMQVDVILLDIDMPGPDPFEALRETSRRLPDVPIVWVPHYRPGST